jgi:DNA-binding transcriptional MocR family regulator
MPAGICSDRPVPPDISFSRPILEFLSVLDQERGKNMVMPGLRPVSARAAALPGSTLTELYLLALSRGAIDLAVGTPGYPHTAGELVDAAGGAMRAGHNQYALPAGDPALRKLIAEIVCTGADPETEITITAGATEA